MGVRTCDLKGGRERTDVWRYVEGVTRRLGDGEAPKVGRGVEDAMLGCAREWMVRRKVEGRKRKVSDVESMEEGVFRAFWRAVKMSGRFGEINEGDMLGLVGGWKRAGVFEDVLSR